jgi:hypothetical protein
MKSSTTPSCPRAIANFTISSQYRELSRTVLLGNSIKVCERHYNLWVKSRQDALAKDIERAWKLAGSRA